MDGYTPMSMDGPDCTRYCKIMRTQSWVGRERGMNMSGVGEWNSYKIYCMKISEELIKMNRKL